MCLTAPYCMTGERVTARLTSAQADAEGAAAVAAARGAAETAGDVAAEATEKALPVVATSRNDRQQAHQLISNPTCRSPQPAATRARLGIHNGCIIRNGHFKRLLQVLRESLVINGDVCFACK